MLKAVPQPESSALLDGRARQARKAWPERPAHKAAPRMVSLAQLAVAAKQARKAQSEPRAHKAPLVR